MLVEICLHSVLYGMIAALCGFGVLSGTTPSCMPGQLDGNIAAAKFTNLSAFYVHVFAGLFLGGSGSGVWFALQVQQTCWHSSSANMAVLHYKLSKGQCCC